MKFAKSWLFIKVNPRQITRTTANPDSIE